jgi:flagellin-specific chaperone FliS
MAQFRAEVAELLPQCSQPTVNMVPAKKSFRVLQAYTKNGPSNEDYVKMLQTVDQLVRELDQRNGSMSKVYCEIKVKNIEKAITIINEASAKKH